MDRALYIAMGGARESLNAHARQSHNLANANTTGFRADLAQARTVAVEGPGHASRAYAVQEASAAPDLTPGAVVATGRDLDVAVDGEGFIVIQAPDGGEAFTRDGSLRTTAAGILTNGAGHPVMGEGGPIALPPYEKLEIGGDGTVSVRLPGQPEMTVVDRILLARPEPAQLVKDKTGLIRSADGEAAVGDAAVKLASGALESSNVEPITAMVEMIELQRQFETHVRMMSAVEENERAGDRLMRLR